MNTLAPKIKEVIEWERIEWRNNEGGLILPPKQDLELLQKQFKCDVKFDFQESGSYLITNNFIGTTLLSDGTTFVIKPKLSLDFVTMLALAYNIDITFEEYFPLLNTCSKDILSVFLFVYLRELEKFAKKYLKRRYIETIKTFYGAKGRLLCKESFYQHHRFFKIYKNECRIFELKLDIPENMVLKYGLKRTSILNQSIKNEVLSAKISEKIGEITPYFHGISMPSHVTPADFSRFHYHGFFKPYKAIHELTRLLLSFTEMELKGSDFRFKAFSLDMATLFEKFVIGIFKQITRDVSDQKSVYIKTQEKNLKHAYLDGFLEKEKILIECKYKSIFEIEHLSNEETIQIRNWRISTADIYQTAAYLQFQKLDAKCALMVYPLAGGNRVLWDNDPIISWPKPIYILGIPVEEIRIQEIITQLREILKNLECN